MFKQLTPEEEQEYRQWARDNFVEGQAPSPVWHPVVVNEWYMLQAKIDHDDVLWQELLDE